MQHPNPTAARDQCQLSSSDPSFLQSARAGGDLGVLHVDATKVGGLVVRQIVHGSLSNVEPSARMIDGKHVDGLAVVRQRVALAAL